MADYCYNYVHVTDDEALMAEIARRVTPYLEAILKRAATSVA